jgi:L-ribulose-5-phosphate 3-epimerase
MQDLTLSRRQFLVASGSAAVLAGGMSVTAGELHGRIRKAMIIGPVTEAALAPIKEAGFAGVETRNVCGEKEAAEGRVIAEKMGMRIHSVMRGWMDFNSEDPKKVEESLEATRKALRAAKAYGADDILLVPCRVGGIPMPEAWDFDIDFDEKTGHVTRVAAGDNSKYEQYIAAQNRATDTSRAAVEKLIPLAEELKIIIALENVWNNLWVMPELYKNFVSSFENRWVRSYFDIGNHVKYAPPQKWIKTLGGLIVRLHFKDFKLNPDGHGGHFVHPRDGSIEWPAVRQALSDIGFDGWGSIEDDGLPLAEFNRRFDLILAGK